MYSNSVIYRYHWQGSMLWVGFDAMDRVRSHIYRNLPKVKLSYYSLGYRWLQSIKLRKPNHNLFSVISVMFLSLIIHLL